MADVKIFTSNTCPVCSEAKAFMKKNKIKYEEIKMETMPEAKAQALGREIIKSGEQLAIPVFKNKCKKIMVGFDKKELKKHIKCQT